MRRASGRAGGTGRAGAHKPVAARNSAAIRKSAAAKPRVARPARAAAAAIAMPLPLRVARAPFTRALRARGNGVLEALLRGPGWIALVGVLLAGIVFFNVDLLKLNRDIAGTAQKSSGIARENARLRLEVAKLGSSERVQLSAATRGLLLPAPGDVRYLRANPILDGRRAAKLVKAPSGSAVVPSPIPQDTTPQATATQPAVAQPQAAPTAPALHPQAQQLQQGISTTAAPTG